MLVLEGRAFSAPGLLTQSPQCMFAPCSDGLIFCFSGVFKVRASPLFSKLKDLTFFFFSSFSHTSVCLQLLHWSFTSYFQKASGKSDYMSHSESWWRLSLGCCHVSALQQRSLTLCNDHFSANEQLAGVALSDTQHTNNHLNKHLNKGGERKYSIFFTSGSLEWTQSQNSSPLSPRPPPGLTLALCSPHCSAMIRTKCLPSLNKEHKLF